MKHQPEQRQHGPTVSGRGQDRSGKEQVAFILRLALILGMVSAYAVGFSPLYRLTGSAVWAALAIFPVIAAAWFWGLRAALLAALLCSLLSGLLVSLVQPSQWNVIGRTLLASLAAYFPVGGVVGRLRDLGARLRDQISERRRAEEALREYQQGLEYLVEQRTQELAQRTDALERELTGRKRAGEALRDSEERFRVLFELAPDAYYLSDLKGSFIDGNKAAERTVGYERDELIGKSFLKLKLLSPKQIAKAAALVARNALGRPTGPDEFVLNRRDGTRVPVEISTVPVKIGGRTVVLGIARDITERKRAEEALRESEEKYRNVVERANDGIVIIQEAIVRYANPRLAEMWGATLQELIGTPFADHVHPDELPKVVDRYKRRMAGEDVTPIYETILSRNDGTKLYAELNAGIITYQGNPANLVIVRDITERKRVEEALRESEERYRSFVQNFQGIAFGGQMDFTPIFFHGAVEEITGYTEEEFTAARPRWDQVIHPDDLAQFYNTAEKIIAVPGYSADREYRIVRKDGQVRWIRDLVQNVCDEVGRPAFVHGALYDITDRKRAEEQLRRYAAELERANQELRDFTYIVSHDLRAPLINLKGFAGELRQALGVVRDVMKIASPYLGEEQRQALTTALQEYVPEALEFIDASATRMDQLIRALLKLSRVGRRDLNLTPIDMDALVEETLQTLAHQIEEGQVRVTVAPLPQVVADRTSMEQIMGNLLSNAINYLDRDRPGEIEISGERGQEETVFRVRDNGRGIAEEDMDKVFAPFRRAGRQDRPGEGMGLAYVQALVRRHGGRIWCESELGVGTTFTFTIPNQLEKGGDHE